MTRVAPGPFRLAFLAGAEAEIGLEELPDPINFAFEKLSDGSQRVLLLDAARAELSELEISGGRSRSPRTPLQHFHLGLDPTRGVGARPRYRRSLRPGPRRGPDRPGRRRAGAEERRSRRSNCLETWRKSGASPSTRVGTSIS